MAVAGAAGPIAGSKTVLGLVDQVSHFEADGAVGIGVGAGGVVLNHRKLAHHGVGPAVGRRRRRGTAAAPGAGVEPAPLKSQSGLGFECKVAKI